MSTTASSSSASLPSASCLSHCAKLGVTEEKPIMLDYWSDSQEGKIIIGVRDDDEKLLVKSEDEFTSPIAKIYKVETEYIIVTENSIYVVSSDVATKRISS